MVYISNVLGLGKAEQCKSRAVYMSAMLQDSEHLGKVMKQGTHQQCFKIGKSSAMSKDKICLSNVIG